MAMAQTSSPDNYSLGRGRLYFNRKLSSGLYDGERDLGNSPEFNMNVSIEYLEHFSSRAGLKSKDKKVPMQITPEFTFKLDEIVAENLAMTFLADVNTSVQAASDSVTMTAICKKDRFVELSKRNLAGPITNTYTVDVGVVTGGPYTVGETVTGGTSGATAVVAAFDAVGTLLTVTSPVGTFASGETITGGTSTASATSTTALVTTPASGVITVKKGVTTYVSGTDYTLDSATGRIYFTKNTSIVEGDTVTVVASCGILTETLLNGFAQTQVEGVLRFVSDNPTGPDMELQAWTVTLAPNGDTSFISDKWQELTYKGEILKDEAGHPTNPYCVIRMAG